MFAGKTLETALAKEPVAADFELLHEEAVGENANSTAKRERSVNNLCPRSCPLSMTVGSEPTCGSDGIIYANLCEMRKKTCSRTGVSSLKVSPRPMFSCCRLKFISFTLAIEECERRLREIEGLGLPT